MKQTLGLTSVVVADYDEAIDFYTRILGFELVEDSPQPEQNKRWVVVAPQGSESGVLLARANGEEQASRIGNQTGGRVFLFLFTDDFERDYRRYREQGVVFIRDPKTEDYGTVAVFEDLYGNLWDLVQRATQGADMSGIEERLRELGETLPEPRKAVANYLGCKQSGSTLYVSGRVSATRGVVGSDLTTQEAYVAAREALLDILAIVKKEIGSLDRIVGVEKLLGFVRSSSTFDEQPGVIDGASDLLVDLFGESGRHARTATGVAQLPFGAAVQLEMILRLREEEVPV